MTEDAEGIERYYRAISELQARVIEDQRSILSQVAERMVQTVEKDGRIFVFGSGHSHLLAEEGFYRAGGLAAVVPIFSSALMLHENPTLGSRLERTSGLADSLLQAYSPRPGEMLFIYSNSGVNALPVQMAMLAKNLGLITVGVSSRIYANIAPLSTLGKRLPDVVDHFIDNFGEPGDALLAVEGSDWRVGPSSTIIGTLIWNCLVTEVIDRMQERGLPLPIFASFNMPGAEEHNNTLLEKWRKINPHL